MMVDISQIRGLTLKDPGPLLGAKISRFISAGQPVTMRQVCLVCKGDNVTVIAKLKGLRVKTSGISQQSGSLGDNIALRNQRTSKRIKARVVGVNQVEISL
jgi:flagella basal body P-ring formation protein FlgA